MGTVDKSFDHEVVGLLYGGVVAMLLLAMALVAFFLIYQKKLVSQQLALQTIQSDYQKELFVAAIHAEEQERQRIGSDLHDDLGSSLSAARMLIADLAESGINNARDREVVALIKEILSNSLQDVRNISQNLHPAVLARFGLTKALHNLSNLYTDAFTHGLDVHVELEASLPKTHELALYRIVQEIVNNALKHAQASQVRVQLLQMPHSLVLTVTDNGCGFDYAQTQRSNKVGLGLKSLAARVSLLDATFHLNSVLSQGTEVRVEIPFPNRTPPIRLQEASPSAFLPLQHKQPKAP